MPASKVPQLRRMHVRKNEEHSQSQMLISRVKYHGLAREHHHRAHLLLDGSYLCRNAGIRAAEGNKKLWRASSRRRPKGPDTFHAAHPPRKDPVLTHMTTQRHSFVDERVCRLSLCGCGWVEHRAQNHHFLLRCLCNTVVITRQHSSRRRRA